MSPSAMIPQKRDQTFQMVVRKGDRPEKMAAHWTVGIIMRGYPSRFGQQGEGRRKFADPEAMNRYGQDLFVTMFNICKEVDRTKRDATIQVRWLENGAPSVKVISRLIWVPD